MKKCEILLTKEDEQVLIGTVILDDGKVSTVSKPGYENAMRNVLREPSYVDGVQTSSKDDPEAWFNSLPEQYSGSRVRARML